MAIPSPLNHLKQCGLLKTGWTAVNLGGAIFGISTRFYWFLGMAISGAIALGGDCALAQIKPIPDNTLGALSSVVTPNVAINGIPRDRIDGGAICGKNLFHSFREFNIDEFRGAYFTNPTGIENIFSREDLVKKFRTNNLNDYFKKYARQNHNKRIAKTIVAIPALESLKVDGYYTVSASIIEYESVPEFNKGGC